ncbi:MAG: SUMF1/EgtB/PvdO family nonheme iron enzyme [bacterium]
MSTDDSKKKDEIVKANIIAIQTNSSSLVRRAIQDIDVFTANPNLLINPITKINPKDAAEMVWVPGGTFIMGSPNGVGEKNEHPAHEVTLSGFWIYKYDVTVAQYCAFCIATSRKLPEFPEGYSWEGKLGWNDSVLQQHPIVNVTWYDCKAYADWAGTTLPSEAQWEYAARGPQGNNYPWGGTATATDPYNGWNRTKCVNYYNSYFLGKSTWAVGSFSSGVSWCEAQDMSGNVWQWCSDWYSKDYYKTSPANNPIGPKTGDYRVLRGGSWATDGLDDDEGRCACRYYYYPDYNEGIFGFRCASLY